MNRIGVRYDNVVDFMRKVSFHRALDLVGTFHALRDGGLRGNARLRHPGEALHGGDFRTARGGYRPRHRALRELRCDGRYPHVHFDMVRWGVSLYGLHTCQETRSMINLKPAMSSMRASPTRARFP